MFAWSLVLVLFVDQGCVERNLHFSVENVDLGEVFDEEVVSVSFPFIARGASISIGPIKKKCGCVSAEVALATRPYKQGLLIPAGEIGAVQIRWRIAGDSGQRSTGVEVEITEGEGTSRSTYHIKLTARAVFRRSIEVDPEGPIDLGRFHSALGTTHMVSLRETRGRRFTVNAAEVVGLALPAIHVVPVEQGGSAWSLRIHVQPNGPVGRFTRAIRIATSAMKQSVELLVQGEVVGDVVIDPPYLVTLGVIQRAVEHSRRVRITCTKPTAVFQIRGVRLDEPPSGLPTSSPSTIILGYDEAVRHLTATLRTQSKASVAEVEITCAKTMPTGLFRLDCYIDYLVDEQGGTVKIPVSGLVR